MRFVQSVVASIAVTVACDARAFEVHVVSAVDGQRSRPTRREKLVREGTRVTLYAVVGGPNLALTAEASEVILTEKGAPKHARPPTPANGPWHLQWFRIRTHGSLALQHRSDLPLAGDPLRLRAVARLRGQFPLSRQSAHVDA